MNKSNTKILSIGDIHGRDIWKQVIFGYKDRYDSWKKSDSKESYELPFDKIIFIGDYVDSYDIEPNEVINNLKEIVEFKLSFPERVVLLLGNHDIPYILPGNMCSGHDYANHIDIAEIFSKNLSLFQIIHTHQTDDANYLWIHAGISKSWLNEAISYVQSTSNPFHDEFIEDDFQLYNIAVLIEKMWTYRLFPLFEVSSVSRGYDAHSGPFWVRPEQLLPDTITGFNQIVGHTRQKRINTQRIDESTSVTFIDCLSIGEACLSEI